ncbi:hypothetical protein FDE04_24830 [Vibrio parahaemolyticus]|nr:hypothetical protein [Vibrio parahaemolyticus]EGR0998053.1 hypothetical protein [Vibrio parahaemolyticus]EGR3441884.1 hypothetical protein [Vibrio parahaemolyticus]MQC42563.1 hypothetical protein [Vibrio parahaemolyticus]MQC67317.1 hypothetical protein [Vibrio parahaemolyticus]
MKRQYHRADSQQANRLLKRQTKLGKDRSSISANQEPEVRSSKCKIEQSTRTIRPKHSVLAAFSSLATNAALSGEQRRPPNLNYCAVNTKFKSNRKCQALGIRLKRFVIKIYPDIQLHRI